MQVGVASEFRFLIGRLAGAFAVAPTGRVNFRSHHGARYPNQR